MDKCFDYHSMYGHEIELRTGTYASYGRGFQIFYEDPEHTKTILQFNLSSISENYALGPWLVSFQCEAIAMAKKKLMFKTVGE